MSTIYAILPLLSFLLFVVFIRKRSRAPCLREHIVYASIIWGVWIAVSTEALGLLSLLNRAGVVCAWLFIIGSTTAALHFTPAQGVITTSRADPASFLVCGLWLACAFIVLVVGIAAMVSPPNNWDSMTYHMSRIMHWIRRETIDPFPTHITRQIYQHPWSGFPILHFYLLLGTDRLSSLIQWLSLAGVGLIGSLIAKELKYDKHAEALAALVAISVPMAILQGSSTQNDLTLAYWTMSVVWLLGRTPERVRSIWAGCALGLAILTKQTAVIVVFPFALAWGIAVIHRYGIRRAFLTLVALPTISLVLLSPHLFRNVEMFGNPIGAKSESTQNIEFRFSNDNLNMRLLASNIIRNSALHLQTVFPQVNQCIYNSVKLAHEKLEVSMTEPATTWPGTQFEITLPVRDEDLVSNTLHAILISVASILLVISRNEKFNQGKSRLYLLCLLCGFVLFCALARWQPWHSRLHLPYFLLAAPITAVVLSSYRYATGVIAAILVYVAVSHALSNMNRPLIGNSSIFKKTETEIIFTKRPQLQHAYEMVLRLLDERGATHVGLISGNDDWEYPLWRIKVPRTLESRVFRHVMVDNFSAKYADSTWVPDALITLRGERPSDLNLDDIKFEKILDTHEFAIYIPSQQTFQDAPNKYLTD
jgi:hypothetical protein